MMKLLSWTAVVIWMGLIFSLSHQPATDSSELSQGVTEVIIETIEKVTPQELNFDSREWNHLVRKNAHFFIYLVLGLLVINALRRTGVTGLPSIIWTLVICCLYAVSDELHQNFVPGRSGELRDVLIDTVGASVGVGFYVLVSRFIKRRRTSRLM